MVAPVAEASRDVLEAPLGDEAEPSCRIALALQLLALAIYYLLTLFLAEVKKRLKIYTVIAEFLFHRQWLFGCKGTTYH